MTLVQIAGLSPQLFSAKKRIKSILHLSVTTILLGILLVELLRLLTRYVISPLDFETEILVNIPLLALVTSHDVGTRLQRPRRIIFKIC
jgi:hypothetical protein